MTLFVLNSLNQDFYSIMITRGPFMQMSTHHRLMDMELCCTMSKETPMLNP